MEKLILASDSGGSKTVWRVLNSVGETVKTVRTDGLGAVPETLPIGETVRSALFLLDGFVFSRIYLSLGGPNTSEVENALKNAWPDAAITVSREANGDAMLNAAALLSCSAAVLCGTGSTAVGIKNGRRCYSGGWGPIYGDGGSGGGLCRDALAMYLAGLDRDGEADDLAGVFGFITDGLDIKDFAQRMEVKTRAISLSRRELAALLPQLYGLYLQNSPSAVILFDKAIDEVCRMASGVSDDSPSTRVLLCGGFFRGKSELIERCRERFSRFSSAKLVYESRFDPIVGACTAALTAAGVQITETVFDNILNEKRA